MRRLFYATTVMLAAVLAVTLVPESRPRAKSAAGADAARRLQAAAMPRRSSRTSRSRSRRRRRTTIRASSRSASSSSKSPSTRTAPRWPSSWCRRASSGCRTRISPTSASRRSPISPKPSISTPRTDSGWAAIAGYANDPTASPLPDRQGVICAPADPTIDPKAFEALRRARRPSRRSGAIRPRMASTCAARRSRIRRSPKSSAFIWCACCPTALQPTTPTSRVPARRAAVGQRPAIVPEDMISGLGGDAMCYSKGPSGWKIAGYFGGAPQSGQ